MAHQPRLPLRMPDRLEGVLIVLRDLGWVPEPPSRPRPKVRWMLSGTAWRLSVDHHTCSIYRVASPEGATAMKHFRTWELGKIRQHLESLTTPHPLEETG
jgi:hypothetical protein